MKKHKKTKKSTKPRSSKWEFFDDCEICQAMKNAEKDDKILSLEELKESFKKQNNKNPLPKWFVSKTSK